MDKALDEADAVTGFTSLKADPGRVGLDSVLRASAKLAFLRDLNLPGVLLSSIHPKVLERFRRRLASESAWDAARQSGWDWHDNQDEGGRCRDTGRT